MSIIHVTVYEPDLRAISALVTNDGSLSFGRWLPGPHGIQVRLEPWGSGRCAGVEQKVVELLLSVPATVAATFVAAWLYDHLGGGKAKGLRIDRTEVSIEEGEIRRVLHEHIECD